MAKCSSATGNTVRGTVTHLNRKSLTQKSGHSPTAKAGGTHWDFPGWRSLAFAALYGMGMAAVTVVFSKLIPVAPPQTSLSFPRALLVLLSLVSVPIEEWISRGFLLRYLWRWFGIVPALVLSSAAFAALHLSWPRFWSRFTAGMLLGLLYYRTRSLWPCMVAHFTHNMSILALVLVLK